MAEIDPVEYGKLLSKVEALERQMNLMEDDIKALLALANQGRGGFWAGMAIASLFGAIISYITSTFFHR